MPINNLVSIYEKSKGIQFCDSGITSFKGHFIPRGEHGSSDSHKVVVRIKDFGDSKGKKPEVLSQRFWGISTIRD